MTAPKPAIEKMSEKFQMIFAGVINTYEELPPQLCVTLTSKKRPDGTTEPCLVLCHYKLDEDSDKLVYTPLAELLTSRMTGNYEIKDVVASHDITLEMYTALQRSLEDPSVDKEFANLTPEYFEQRPPEAEWRKFIFTNFPTDPADN